MNKNRLNKKILKCEKFVNNNNTRTYAEKTCNLKCFSKIDCERDPIENKKEGLNCTVLKKKIKQTVNHEFTPDFKIIVPFHDKIL